MTFFYSRTGDSESVKRFLGANLARTVQCDGTSMTTFLERTGGKRPGCWSHGRRGLVEAALRGDTLALEGVRIIASCSPSSASRSSRATTPTQRRDRRQRSGQPVLDELREWVDNQMAVMPPKTPSAGASDTSIGSGTVCCSFSMMETSRRPTTDASATAASAGGATNASSAVLAVTRGALTITKTVISPTNNATVAIGSNVVFRIIIKNTGQTTVTSLPLEDTYSADVFQFVSATIPPNSIGAGDLLWTNLSRAFATNAVLTNDVTLKVVGAASPALNTAAANDAVDSNGSAVSPASGTASVTTGAGKISGHAYNDLDQSGTPTAGDQPLQSVSITLYTDPNGDGNPADGTVAQLTTTDVNGYYELLNLNPGAYVVVAALLPGYAGTAPPNGRMPVVLSALTTNANNNFFQYQPPPASYATIGGTVWNDVTGIGSYQAGDFGISNVTVTLVQDLNSNGVADAGEPVVQSVFTAANGGYSFSGRGVRLLRRS